MALPLYYMGVVYWVAVLRQGQDKPIKNVQHFLHESASFQGHVKHFYHWTNMPFKWTVSLPIQHHFVMRTKCYSDSQNCSVDMIHFSGGEEVLGDEDGSKPIVILTHFKIKSGTGEFVNGSKYYYDQLSNGEWHMLTPWGQKEQTEQEADDRWRKAQSKIGTTGYNFFMNNCEHFVNDILYDNPTSIQVLAKGSLSFRKLKMAGKGMVYNKTLDTIMPRFIIGESLTTSTSVKDAQIREMNVLKRRSLDYLEMTSKLGTIFLFDQMITAKRKMYG